MNLKNKTSFLIWVRRISLSTIILLLFLSPLTQILRTYRQDPYPYLHSPLINSNYLNSFLKVIDHGARETLDPFYNFISSGPYSSSFYDIKFTEPLTISSHMIASLVNWKNITIPLLITFSLSTLIYFLFGRIFCGYICPMSFFSNFNQKIQKNIFKRKKSLNRTKSKVYLHKYKLFYISSFIFIFLNPLLLQYILPPAVLQHLVSDYILYGGFTLWAAFFLILFAYEISKPGHFCKYLCPTGVFLTFVSKVKVFKLTHTETKCPSGCTNCIEACWLGLNPKGTDIGETSCDLCSRCVDVCPVDRIRLSHKLKVAKTLILLIFIVLISPQQSIANTWSENEAYHFEIQERTIFENTVSKTFDNDLYIFYYAVVLKTPEKNDKINASLYIHVTKNSEWFNSDAVITINSNTTSEKCILKAYNSPISIGKMSTYLCDYNFNFTPVSKAVVWLGIPKFTITLPIIYSNRH